MTRFARIFEAAPTPGIKETPQYHGTSKFQYGIAILETGFLRGREVQGRQRFAPIVGRVYITPDLGYALIYSVGANIIGQSADGWLGKEGEIGFVFEVDPASIVDVQPDEDSVGEMVCDALRLEKGKQAYHKYDMSEIGWLSTFARGYISPNTLKKVEDGEFAEMVKVGKVLLNKRLTDRQKIQLINAGAHIASQGEAKWKRAWVWDKTRSPELKRDGSNFFSSGVAVEVKNKGDVMKFARDNNIQTPVTESMQSRWDEAVLNEIDAYMQKRGILNAEDKDSIFKLASSVKLPSAYMTELTQLLRVKVLNKEDKISILRMFKNGIKERDHDNVS